MNDGWHDWPAQPTASAGEGEVPGLRGRERPQRSGGMGLRGRERAQRSGGMGLRGRERPQRSGKQ